MRARTVRRIAAHGLKLSLAAALMAGSSSVAYAETSARADVELSQSLSGSYLAGRFARAENDTGRAASYYGNALMFDPASDMLLEQAVLMEASQGNWDRAVRLAEGLAELEPQHRMARMFLGLGAFKTKDWKKAEEHFKAASSGPIGELTSSLAMAWIKLAAGKTSEALNVLQVPKQAEWAQFYLRYHRALVADAAGRKSEARSTFERVFKQDGRTLRTALAYVRSLAHAGDLRAARAALKDHLNKTQGDGHPLARALQQELQAGKKIDLLVTTPTDGLAEVFYGLGESLIGEGAIGVGVVYLQMALFVAPEHPFALAALANAYEANKQYQDAIDVYDRIPKGSPLEPAIEIRKAFNLNSLDRPDDARAVLERLLGDTPDPAGTQSNDAPATTDAAEAPAPAAPPETPAEPVIDLKPSDLGDRVLKIGSDGDSVRELQGALAQLGYDIGGAVDGRFGEATRTAVMAFQQSKNLEQDGLVGQETLAAIIADASVARGKAEASTGPSDSAQPQKAALDDIERLQALDALGNILRSRKLYAEAVGIYDRAIAMVGKPQRRHWAYFYARGTSYERLKNWPAAETDLKKALELYPDQPLVLNYLGYSWVDQGINLDKGMMLIERAVAVKPDDGYIVDSLGWAHYKRGNFKEAVRYLERAVELRPDDPVLNDHLGDALWRVGREREARFQWDQALSLKPEADDEIKIKRKLTEGLAAVEGETQAAANGAVTPGGVADSPKPTTP